MRWSRSLSAIAAGLMVLIVGPIYDRSRAIPVDAPALSSLAEAKGKVTHVREDMRRRHDADTLPIKQFLALTIDTSPGWVTVRLPKDWPGSAVGDLQGSIVSVRYDPAGKHVVYELRSGAQQLLSYDEAVAGRGRALAAVDSNNLRLRWLGVGAIAIGLIGLWLGRRTT